MPTTQRRVLHTDLMRAVHSRLLVLAFASGSVTLAAVQSAPVQEWTFATLDGITVTFPGVRAHDAV